MLDTIFHKSNLRYALNHWALQPLRYAINRWVLPHLGTEPLAIKNLSQKAWPTVAALTSERTYTDQIECIEWESARNSDGTELLEEYARMSRPLLLKGYATSSIGGSWAPEWVKQVAGDTMGKIRLGKYTSAIGDPKIVLMRLADFIDYLLGQSAFPHPNQLADGMAPYLGNMPIPLLDEYLPCPRFLAEAPHTHFWLGNAGSGTPLHCHQHGDFLILQLIGHRRFVLIPPHEALFVGHLLNDLNVSAAAFDPFKPDRDRFPVDHIHRLQVDLEPGDALLLPGFWFHAIQIDELSMSATRSRKNSMPAAIGGGPLHPWRTRPYYRGW